MIVILEGINGAGKTTLAKRLARDLTTKSRKVARASFPTSGLKRSGEDGRATWQDYIEDMGEEMERLRQENPKKNTVFLLDRSFVSTAVYQWEDRDEAIRLGAQALLKPCEDVLVVWTTCNSDIAADRLKRRATDPEKDGTSGLHNVGDKTRLAIAQALDEDHRRFRQVLDELNREDAIVSRSIGYGWYEYHADWDNVAEKEYKELAKRIRKHL